MKIKGAFPVRWAAQNGADGTGVTVASQQVKYASSTQGTDHPTTGWQTSIPNVADGNFLWTWLHLVFSDGKYTDIYSSARQGIDGRGIQSSSVTYSQQATSVNPETITNWGGFPSELIDGYWLYTRTVITYSDGAPSTSYSVSQIGTGSYYAGTAEYFAAGVSPDTPPEGYAAMGTYVSGETIQTTWKQERPRLTAETPYLWNFEISSDSRGNRYVTDVICIGNFAKGIVSIVETYAISAHGSVEDGRDYPEDILEKDWTDEHFAAPPTNEKPYQWNKTTTTYNDGSVQNNYHISAIKGIDGKGAIYIDLDNENDSMLYDGSDNLISGNMVSNIKLYDNGVDVTSGRTFSIDSISGVNADIDGAVLTITAMSANSGYVVVKCIYNSVPYYARFTCKKVIGTDKYEVVCKPSALTFNEDTDTPRQTTVTVCVYKTAQNGTREPLQKLPSGYTLKRKWSDSVLGTKLDYADGKSTFIPLDDIYDRYRVELSDASGVVLDYETIPICRVKNGEKGESAFVLDAENENIGFVVDNNGRYSESQSRTIKINAYYGAAKVTSGVTYSVETEGNIDASGHAYLVVSEVTNGEITIGTQDNIVWTKDKVVNVKITATHATYGTRSIIISCVPVFGGADGLPATLYELQPSLDVLSFARNEKGGYSPDSLKVYCGYIKIVGSSRTSYAGNDVSNLLNIDGKYEIMWRYHRTDVSVLGWNWNKDSPNGTIMVNGLSSNTAIEFIFTSAAGINYVDDSNIFDRVVVPIVRDGAKGYSGAKPYFRRFSEIKGVATKVYQGVSDEEWYTIIYDDINHTGWYTPLYSHTTTTDEVLTDASKWRMSSMDFVATSVFFAQMAYIENLGVRNVLLSNGKEIEGGMCYSDDNGNGGSLGLGDIRFWLGSSNPSSGKIRGYKDGKFVAAGGKAVFDPSGDVSLCGGNAKFDKDGNTTIANLNATSGKFTGEVNATSGKFTDVEVNGSMRSAFTAPSGIGDVDVNDCISLISNGVGTVVDEYSLPWDVKQSGRRISIVNWKWNGQTSTGFASIEAPTGKYFFEDGIQKSELKLSRQAVELLGYGTSDDFYGWIVMRRENIMTAYQYGKCQRVLFWGSVRCSSSSSYSLSQAWYDGTNNKASLTRVSTGLYRISFPSDIIADAKYLLVMATGFGYVAGNSTNPCKATIVAKSTNSFDVVVSDDETRNDGSFDFFVANLIDWL